MMLSDCMLECALEAAPLHAPLEGWESVGMERTAAVIDYVLSNRLQICLFLYILIC